MNDHELEQFILNYLANHSVAWVDFYELDTALAVAAKDWKEEVRKSYLRGALGRMIHTGQIVREKKLAKYKIGDETMSLFQEAIP